MAKTKSKLAPDVEQARLARREIVARKIAGNGIEAWREQARALAKAHKDHQWEIGDLLVGGERIFGRKVYKEAAAIFTDWGPETLKDYAYVARRVPALARANDLSWRHHKLVARFEPDLQQKLLAFAVNGIPNCNVSAERFRTYINQNSPPAKKARKQSRAITVTLPPDVVASVELLAKANGRRLDQAVCYLLGLALQIPEIKRAIVAATGDTGLLDGHSVTAIVDVDAGPGPRKVTLERFTAALESTQWSA